VNKSTLITFNVRNKTCPTVQMGNVDLPQKNEVKYLCMHLNSRLTWAKHIKSKRKQFNLKAKQVKWLLVRLTLSTESKLLPYRAVMKPVWTYGIQLWGIASSSNIEILLRFQVKTFRSILKAPWYINNHRIHDDLHVNTVLSEIKSGIPNKLKLCGEVYRPSDCRVWAKLVPTFTGRRLKRGNRILFLYTFIIQNLQNLL
jgi:hypothetical protein